jgi:putative ABC transport system permease protein
MNLLQLALKNISGSSFRSSVVGLCALLVVAFALFATLLMRGAEDSLRLALDRLGADIVVVPEGTEAKVESALLMGTPAKVWMSQDVVQKVSTIQGVETVSPQLFLASLSGASCCSVSDMFIIAYEPQTDFTISPWLTRKLGGGLGLGEVVGGSYIFATESGEKIKIYGSLVSIKANLEPTGTGLDNSLFVTFETARNIALLSTTLAQKPLEIPDRSISAAMIKVKPGYDPKQIAYQILMDVPGVTPIESANMFQSYRKQMDGLLKGTLINLGLTWGLSIALIGLVFSMAANERRRELGVLRALGATRQVIFQSLLLEASSLAFIGGVAGIILADLVIFLFRKLVMVTLGIPFLLPSPVMLLAMAMGGLLLSLFSVNLAALIPAYQISRQDPAIAMRE